MQRRLQGTQVPSLPQCSLRLASWPLRWCKRGRALQHLLHNRARFWGVLPSLLRTRIPHKLHREPPQAPLVHAEDHLRLHVLPELQAGNLAQGTVQTDCSRAWTLAQPQEAGRGASLGQCRGTGHPQRWAPLKWKWCLLWLAPGVREPPLLILRVLCMQKAIFRWPDRLRTRDE